MQDRDLFNAEALAERQNWETGPNGYWARE